MAHGIEAVLQWSTLKIGATMENKNNFYKQLVLIVTGTVTDVPQTFFHP